MPYDPEPVPQSPEALSEFLARELRRVSESFYEITEIQLVELNAEPDKPRTGMVVLADGVNWNPGSGGGVYAYYSSSWNKLG